MERIEIPVKNTRMIVGLFVAVAFIILGVYLLMLAQNMEGYPIVLYIIGGFMIAVFGYLLIFSLIKLLGTKVGLILDDEGLTDYSNLAVLTIRWEDVTDIRVDSVMMNKAIVFYTKTEKAQAMLNSSQGKQRRMHKNNLKMFGSPLAVVTTNIKITNEDLHRMVMDRYEQHNRKKESSQTAE